MPTAIREEVVARLATAISTVASGLSYAFERNRYVPIEDAEVPALVLFDMGERVVEGSSGDLERELRVEVEAYVTAETGAALGAAMSDVAARIRQAVRPSAAGMTLEGYASEIREVEMTDPDIGRDASAGAYAAFSIAFDVVYRTAEFDPYAQA